MVNRAYTCRGIVEVIRAKHLFLSSCMRLAYVCMIIDTFDFRYYWKQNRTSLCLMIPASYIFRTNSNRSISYETFFLLYGTRSYACYDSCNYRSFCILLFIVLGWSGVLFFQRRKSFFELKFVLTSLPYNISTY